MRLYRVALLIILAVLVFVDLCETSRSRRSSRTNRNRRPSKTKPTGSVSVSKKKITKNTPMAVTSRKSPVIVSQTQRGSRSIHNVLFGFITYQYLISNAPVYNHGYPMFSRSVAIPEERAARIMFITTKMLDREGKLCLDENQWKSEWKIPEGANETVIKAKTTIRYGNAKPVEFDGINKEFMLQEKEGVDFKIESRTEYNITLVEGKNVLLWNRW